MSTLTPQQLEAYQNTGFLLVKGFVPLAQVAEIRDEVAGLHAGPCWSREHPWLGDYLGRSARGRAPPRFVS